MYRSEVNCDELAKTLGGKGKTENGICEVSVERKDIKAAIGNRPFLSLQHMFVFQSPDANGMSLITCELVVTENEVDGFNSGISGAGIIVSAVHNHWLYDEPRLMYIHAETIMDPSEYADIMAKILNKQRLSG
jgi:hypothetical protein